MMALLGRDILRKGGQLTNAFRGLSSLAESSVEQNVSLQEAAMDNENCLLVNALDKPIGMATKRQCHLIGDTGELLLHRAFSVFLFNERGDLLLHKRSPTKITFPNSWTNSCCSHPLPELPGENVEYQAAGIKTAAMKRLNLELGIPMNEMKPEELHYITRIHYKHLQTGGKWGEHEITYVLFLQKKEITLKPNPDEICDIKWVPKDKLQEFVQNRNSPFTPWFAIFLEHCLPLWWENLKTMHVVQDHAAIRRFS